MKKEIAVILIMFFSAFYCISQEKTPQHTYNVPKVSTPASDSRIEVAENGDTVLISKYSIQNSQNNSRLFSEKVYKGTPFFMNGWYPGVLYFDDGSVINGTLAFNLVNNLVYYSMGPNSDATESKPLAFTIREKTLAKLNSKYQNTMAGYFELIFGGPKLDLFRQYYCNYHGKNTGEITGYESDASPYEGSYDKTSKLFMGWNNQVIELKTNNNIYKQFGEYRTAMEKFGKENKLNYKKEGDIISLVVHFSGLVDEFEK